MDLSASSKKRLKHKANEHSGFALPLVVVVGLILTVGGFALMARSFSGLVGSIRSEQARQAREIAEAGMAETIENLNRRFNYLLINCYQNQPDECQNIVFNLNTSGGSDLVGLWDAPRYPSSVCPGAQRLPYTQFTKAISSPKGEYKILSYVFDGTQFYGGKGTLTIEGTRRTNDNQILATSVIQKTFEVKPKNCGADLKGNANNSGFPGLKANSISLGGNDVKGSISGNILCSECEYADPLNPQPGEERELIKANPNEDISQIDGNIFIGEITEPDVWPIPSAIRAKIAPKDDEGAEIIKPLQDFIDHEEVDDKKSNTYKITAGTAPASTESISTSHGGMCATDVPDPSIADGQAITYCITSSIVLSNTEQLKIDTTNGPVKLYVTGNVDVGGQRSIQQTRSDGEDTSAFRLGLFGLNQSECSAAREVASDNNTTFQQEVWLAGVSKTKNGEDPKAANLFVHFPCGKVGIKGGAQSEAECNTTDPTITPDNATAGQIPYGDCGGGDLRGVVWAEEWDGSNSNNAQLVVPPNAADDGLKNQGFEYSISVKDYVAVGTNSWFGFGGLLGR
jgi:hypothetical protein